MRKGGKTNGATITDDTVFVDGDGIEPPTQGFSVPLGRRNRRMLLVFAMVGVALNRLFVLLGHTCDTA